MYKVYRNHKFLKSLGTFSSYDDARNAARRFIRTLDSYSAYWSTTNPALSEYGISVRRK